MNKPRFPSARPAEVGPHDVSVEQNDPDAKLRRPEEAYSEETGGQADGVGRRPPTPGARALVRPKTDASGQEAGDGMDGGKG
ncbi:hypothetical protein NON00_23570 [Roseomonas sp. GC11]|uniref:hypothetical protein n=1 Tax=Roseomonas sp. GC11 TaxID=2950546 RepID=UPI00210CB643|nr:hypothetical protein [Roseomonas sp. GC11]MCQ4162886.1 hypothetical protein [Roseomonas sp. GC11]